MSTTPQTQPKTSKPKKSAKVRAVRWLILILVLACIGLYLWKFFGDKSHADELAKVKSDSAAACEKELLDGQQELLSMSGVLASWAAADVANKQNNVINVRLDELIKLPRVTKVSVAGQDNVYFASTDKKQIGAAITAPANAVTVTKTDDGKLVTSPLVHGSVRVGTIQIWWKDAN